MITNGGKRMSCASSENLGARRCSSHSVNSRKLRSSIALSTMALTGRSCRLWRVSPLAAQLRRCEARTRATSPLSRNSRSGASSVYLAPSSGQSSFATWVAPDSLGGGAGGSLLSSVLCVNVLASSGGGAGNGGPGGASGAASPLPDDIGDGQGDNIVERQIREAAMRESDPVLREKLWGEYRRVKGQE